MGTFIADLVLQILFWAAEDERGCIRKRQPEGIDAVLNNGKPYGRPKFQKNFGRLMKSGSKAILQLLERWRKLV